MTMEKLRVEKLRVRNSELRDKLEEMTKKYEALKEGTVIVSDSPLDLDCNKELTHKLNTAEEHIEELKNRLERADLSQSKLVAQTSAAAECQDGDTAMEKLRVEKLRARNSELRDKLEEMTKKSTKRSAKR